MSRASLAVGAGVGGQLTLPPPPPPTLRSSPAHPPQVKEAAIVSKEDGSLWAGTQDFCPRSVYKYNERQVDEIAGWVVCVCGGGGITW